MSFAVREDARGRVVYKELADIDTKFNRAIRRGWFEFGIALKKEANKEILRRPKSGRTYMVRGPSGRRRRHVASAPFETHANLGGDLRKSIGWKVHGHDSMTFGFGVASTGANPAPIYAGAIELGRRDGSILPRLSLFNAIEVVDATDYVDGAMLKEFPS